MISGTGCDICKISRFETWIDDEKKLLKIFSPAEIIHSENRQMLLEHYASRFAAKEAFVKATGTGFAEFSANEIHVVKNEKGKPFIELSGKALDYFVRNYGQTEMIHLSISHEKEYAMAFVIIEK